MSFPEEGWPGEFSDDEDREAMLDAYYEDMSIEDHRPDPEP